MKEKIESKSNGGSFFVHQIVKSNSYTELAANRMFVLLMRELDIDHQIVLTCSRYDRVFDGDFESYTYLNNYLVYFPKYDQYAVPSYDFYRFGIVPTDLTYQKGLFIKTISVGGVVSSFPEIKEISGLNKSNNKDNLYVNVDIANDFSTINLKIKKEMMAYHSIAIQPYLPYLSIEKREENLNALFTDIGIGVKITNVVLENEKVEGYQIGKQFIVKADVEAESLLDKAGNKHLFKIGQVIGAQSELYQDKKRKYDVVNSNNRWYYREISLTIPEGYVISNLQDLNMDVYFENKGVKTLEFKSEYELSGNKLIVKVNEYYDQINIPKENYEQFRAVINAAADFNKKVLIFEKEKVK